MSIKDKEKIKCYTEAYLFWVSEATAPQIEGHLRKAPYKFQGGKPSKQKIASILTTSSRFISKPKDGQTFFKLANE